MASECGQALCGYDEEKIMMKLKVLMTLFVFLIVTVAHAETYKWLDNDGRIHFTDRPPFDRPYELINQPDSVPSNSQQRMKSLVESQKKAQEDRQAMKEDRAKQESEKKMLDERCEKLRKRESVLANRPARKIFTTDDDGTKRRLTEEEKEERLKKVKKQIKEVCS